MNINIAFLRGINVSGHNKIKMSDLKNALENSGFIDVTTYIQSGNLVLKSTIDPSHVAEKVEAVIEEEFGFEVPVLISTAEEVESILKKNPFFKETETKNLYFALPFSKPDKDLMANLDPEAYPNEEFHISENCIYLNCKLGAGKAKLNNNLIERKLKLTATTRNRRTLQKLVELARSKT